ncbi:MAG: NAD-dependent epimerase/dehydratase family protein [Candidatus Rokubacteria bacterium]|nr:NAD-dependent epimerase/dehydratase family protein [Candidatus Rokubacteria bacterium]
MDVLVTGGTGFVGANLVRALLADGHSVRVLVRPESEKRALVGCPVELVAGDLLDPASLRRAVTGCRVVFHVAADYRLWTRTPEALYRTNVDGTRNVLDACARAEVGRVVYTSTVGTLGISKDGRPGTETTPVTLDEMVGPYKRSKFLAERVAEEFAARGLPVVIVNPSAPVGPWDVKPTPTGQMIVDFLKGRMFATLDTGLNLVHVADVARGHILAAEKGRAGEKYILGNQNCSLAEIFALLARITGLPAPRHRVPYAVAWLGALFMAGAARLTGRPPRVSLTAVRMAKKRMYFSPEKAVRELGLPQSPVEQAVGDAVEWFVAHGYAPPLPHVRGRGGAGS